MQKVKQAKKNEEIKLKQTILQKQFEDTMNNIPTESREHEREEHKRADNVPSSDAISKLLSDLQALEKADSKSLPPDRAESSITLSQIRTCVEIRSKRKVDLKATIVIMPVPKYAKSRFKWLPINQAYIRIKSTYYPLYNINNGTLVVASKIDPWIREISDLFPGMDFLEKFGFWFQLEHSMMISEEKTSHWGKRWKHVADCVASHQAKTGIPEDFGHLGGIFEPRQPAFVRLKKLECKSTNFGEEAEYSTSQLIRMYMKGHKALIKPEIQTQIVTKFGVKFIEYTVFEPPQQKQSRVK